MRAVDAMVRNVITVGPEASVGDVADLLLMHRISALPVVDANGKVVGIISEGDLLRRAETGTERHRSRWLEWVTSRETLAIDFVKSHSRRVSDLMSRHVVSVTPDTPLDEVATILEKNGIKRVPVVDNGRLVGILSRANLVQALAAVYKKIGPRAADDSALRAGVVAQLEKHSWAGRGVINVIVCDGTVDLWGLVDSDAESEAARVAAETVPGVKMVNNHLRKWGSEFDY
jgi:CBS domain-containing protein